MTTHRFFQLRDLESHYIEALSLHTIFLQMGFVRNQLFFVPEHLNVGISIAWGGLHYRFNCAYLTAQYRREDVIAGWPQVLEMWYGELPAANVAAAEMVSAETEVTRWGLIYDSNIYRYLPQILDVLESKAILDYPRKLYVKSIEAMKVQVIGCHPKP